MRDDRQEYRLEVAVVPAGHGRSGVPAGRWDRCGDDLPGFVSVLGGSPSVGLRRQTNNQPDPSAASGSVGRKTVIVALRCADATFVVLIVVLLVIAWLL